MVGNRNETEPPPEQTERENIISPAIRCSWPPSEEGEKVHFTRARTFAGFYRRTFIYGHQN